MKRSVLLTGLGILGFFLMTWGSPLCPQEAPAQKKAKSHEIEGIWTQVHSETDGDSSPSMRNPGYDPPGPMRGTGGNGSGLGQYVWKFSKEEVGSGWIEDQSFPIFRSHYQLDPDGKMGAMDMIPLDKQGKKMEKEKVNGIYFLKDDILIICFAYENGAPRPEGFTTSALSKSRLVFLRRGKLK
jgi:uncharacterized protein (TIGR03067 family)